MSNPLLTINRFAIRTKNALVKLSYTTPVYSDGTNVPMLDAILDLICNLRDTNTKGYLGFTSYKRNHQKEDIEHISAVTMEYPFAKKTQLLERLNEMAFHYYLIDTQSDFDAKSEARILVAFPVLDPITSPRVYSRVASLLWDEIGIEAATSGSQSSTFLFAPYTANPGAWYVERDQFLDAQVHYDDHQGQWVKVGQPITEKPMASNDGLFDWGD